ncbi:MAG: hypothetical protein ACOC1O_04020 [bacterium]
MYTITYNSGLQLCLKINIYKLYSNKSYGYYASIEIEIVGEKGDEEVELDGREGEKALEIV